MRVIFESADENISSIKFNDSFITPTADHAVESDFDYFVEEFSLLLSGGWVFMERR